VTVTTSVVEHPSSEPRIDASEMNISIDEPEYEAHEAENEGGGHVAYRQRVGGRLTPRCLEHRRGSSVPACRRRIRR